MHVLIATDKYAGTLSAVEASAAIAEGWRRRDPDARIATIPMADGGPGFLDVLHASLGGQLREMSVTGPLREPTRGQVLAVDDEAGRRTAYVESAQACGLHLVEPDRRRPEKATSFGVGELIGAAVDAGADRVVVGLGGSGTIDAGAGMLAALGAGGEPGDALRRGPSGLAELTSVDVTAARARIHGVELVAATDVDNPLLGLRGATNIFGPQKGVADDRLPAVDALLEDFADLVDRRLADAKGAGAAGGLGYALLLLGGTRESGIDIVAEVTGLAAAARAAELVLTGEGSFDAQSRGGKVVFGVAQVAGAAARPCVVLAGQVRVGSREMRTMGIESAYGLIDVVGREQAFAEPYGSLVTLAERVARTWAR